MVSLRIGLVTIAAVDLWVTLQANFLERRNDTNFGREETSGSANHTVTAIAEARSALQVLKEKANALDAEANSQIGNMSTAARASAPIETVHGTANSSALRGNSVRAAESKVRDQPGNASDTVGATAKQSQQKIQAMGESATSHFLEAKSEVKVGAAKSQGTNSISQGGPSAHGLQGAVNADKKTEKTHIAMVQAKTGHQNTTSKNDNAVAASNNHNTEGIQGHAEEKDTQKSDATDEMTDEADEIGTSEDLDEDDEGTTETEAPDEETQVSTESPENIDEIPGLADALESEDLKASEGISLFQKEATLFPYASWDENSASANVATAVSKDGDKGNAAAKSDASADKVAPSAKVSIDATAGVEADGEDVDDGDTIYLTAGSGTNDGSDDNAGYEDFDSGELSVATEANGMVHDSDDDEHYYDHSMMDGSDGSSDVFDDESSMWGSEWDLGHEEETVETAGDVGEDDEDSDSYDDDYGEEEYDDDPGL